MFHAAGRCVPVNLNVDALRQLCSACDPIDRSSSLKKFRELLLKLIQMNAEQWWSPLIAWNLNCSCGAACMSCTCLKDDRAKTVRSNSATAAYICTQTRCGLMGWCAI